MVKQIGDSNLVHVWATDGIKVNADTSYYEEFPLKTITELGGIPGKTADAPTFNYKKNELGQKVNHLLKNGIAYWHNETGYTSGNTVTYNNEIWLCMTANTGSAPNLLNSNWVKVLKTTDSATIGIIGEVKAIAHNIIDDGWLLCDGTAVSRTTYSNLFARLGTTYGAGNGTTTFNVPDYRGYTLIGKLGVTPTALTTISTNALNGSLANTLGAKMGKDTHILTVGELPTITIRDSLVQPGSTLEDAGPPPNYDLNNRTIGSNLPHNNLPPVAVVNYIIKY